MTVDRKDVLSFIINPSGEVVSATPHEQKFSVQQIRDCVAGYPELVCETCDGFLLFRDRDASTKGLPVNPLASFIYTKYARRPCSVNGLVFLVHPGHVAPYWRTKLRADPKHGRQTA